MTRRSAIVANFAAVYLIWGSTYLAIRFAIETIPPFLMAGIRFTIAGTVLYAWTRARGAERPTRAEWVTTAIVGAFLLLLGNGAVVWAELRVPSGVASLIVATVSLWMVLLDWARPGGVRPTGMVMTGVIVGLAGVALLVGPGSLGGAAVDRVGAIVLIGGSLSWAIGSLYSKRARMPRSPLLATAMEMLAGGALLLVVAAMTGEIGAFHASAVTTRSAVAVLYLITFGSLIGFSAYVWLLRAVSPARVSTYAYVNPVVAVFLGWALAGEPITARTLVAAAIIIGAVALITGGQQKKLVMERREATPREHEAAPAKRARSA